MTDVRVVTARATRDYQLWLRFSDGLAGAISCRGLIDIGAFTMWRDVREFLKVRIEHDGQAITWEAGIRMDPDILYSDIAARYVNYARKIERDSAFQRFMQCTLAPRKRPGRAA